MHVCGYTHVFSNKDMKFSPDYYQTLSEIVIKVICSNETNFT